MFPFLMGFIPFFQTRGCIWKDLSYGVLSLVKKITLYVKIIGFEKKFVKDVGVHVYGKISMIKIKTGGSE